MSESLTEIRHRIRYVEDLRSVVKTMKALAAASITQFEQAVTAVAAYHEVVEQALATCLVTLPSTEPLASRPVRSRVEGILALGTDQGLVGQFNEPVAQSLASRVEGRFGMARLWIVGERLESLVSNVGLESSKGWNAPQSVEAIGQMVSELLVEIEGAYLSGEIASLDCGYNSPATRSSYEIRWFRLLPLDEEWRKRIKAAAPKRGVIPEMIDEGMKSRTELVSEFLFVTLYRAFAESGAAENAARLAAMQRAERNIEERRRDLDFSYNRKRQAGIDEELFDLVSGFRELSRERQAQG